MTSAILSYDILSDQPLTIDPSLSTFKQQNSFSNNNNNIHSTLLPSLSLPSTLPHSSSSTSFNSIPPEVINKKSSKSKSIKSRIKPVKQNKITTKTTTTTTAELETTRRLIQILEPDSSLTFDYTLDDQFNNEAMLEEVLNNKVELDNSSPFIDLKGYSDLDRVLSIVRNTNESISNGLKPIPTSNIPDQNKKLNGFKRVELNESGVNTESETPVASGSGTRNGIISNDVDNREEVERKTKRGRPKGKKDSPSLISSERGRPKGKKNVKGLKKDNLEKSYAEGASRPIPKKRGRPFGSKNHVKPVTIGVNNPTLAIGSSSDIVHLDDVMEEVESNLDEDQVEGPLEHYQPELDQYGQPYNAKLSRLHLNDMTHYFEA